MYDLMYPQVEKIDNITMFIFVGAKMHINPYNDNVVAIIIIIARMSNDLFFIIMCVLKSSPFKPNRQNSGEK
jgi:hypothetical protein